jgi:hypothetical protein
MTNDSTPNPEEYAVWRHPRPAWKDWESAEHARLWQAVALACNLEPTQLTVSGTPRLERSFMDPPPKDFEALLTLAISNIGAGGILTPTSISKEGIEESETALSTFAVWAKSLGYKLPPEFPRKDELVQPLNQGWPWGHYETKLLRRLAAAANRFWKNYDPSDPTTAPTNEEVIKWLKARGVADRTAEVMASILRADGLPTRRRK